MTIILSTRTLSEASESFITTNTADVSHNDREKKRISVSVSTHKLTLE